MKKMNPGHFVLLYPGWGKFGKKKMASASLHGDRSHVVSRGKKPPSPLGQGSKTPIPRSSEAKKRLNSSDGSSKQLVSAAKVPTPGCKSATKQRPSDILNPKTVDPVSNFVRLVVHLGRALVIILASFNSLRLLVCTRFQANCCK